MRVFLITSFSQSSKTMTFCQASATFQGSHQMLRLPRLLTLRHVCAALPLRFMKNTSQNAAPATQMHNATWPSTAPATQKSHAEIDTPLKYCACHAKRKNDLPSCDFEASKRAFRARLPSNFTLQRNSSKPPPKALPNGSELTTQRRRGDDEATTTRRHTTTRRQKRSEHRSNPRPQL